MKLQPIQINSPKQFEKSKKSNIFTLQVIKEGIEIHQEQIEFNINLSEQAKVNIKGDVFEIQRISFNGEDKLIKYYV